MSKSVLKVGDRVRSIEPKAPKVNGTLIEYWPDPPGEKHILDCVVKFDNQGITKHITHTKYLRKITL